MCSPSEILAVWIMVQEPGLSRALNEEVTGRKEPCSTLQQDRQVPIPDSQRPEMGFDPIDAGEPGDEGY